MIFCSIKEKYGHLEKNWKIEKLRWKKERKEDRIKPTCREWKFFWKKEIERNIKEKRTKAGKGEL